MLTSTAEILPLLEKHIFCLLFFSWISTGVLSVIAVKLSSRCSHCSLLSVVHFVPHSIEIWNLLEEQGDLLFAENDYIDINIY